MKWAGLAASILLLIFAAPARAQNAEQAISQALYASSATSAAWEKIADERLAEQRATIVRLERELANGKRQLRLSRQDADRLEIDISNLRRRFVTELAERDRAYAAEIDAVRQAIDNVLETPSGLDALIKFNAGDWAGAREILDRLNASRQRGREARARIERAGDLRSVARFAFEARAQGLETTLNVTRRFEEVVRLDPTYDDWKALSGLFLDLGRTRDAMQAALQEEKSARSVQERARAMADIAGLMEEAQDGDGAVAKLEAARALLAGATPEERIGSEVLAGNLTTLLANLLFAQGDRQAALGLAREGIDVAEANFSKEKTEQSLYALAASLLIYGEIAGGTEGLQVHERSAKLLRDWLEQHPNAINIRAAVAMRLLAQAAYQHSEDKTKGRAELDEAITMLEDVVRRDPTSTIANFNLVAALSLRFKWFADASGADSSHEQALRLARQHASENRSVDSRRNVAQVLFLLELGEGALPEPVADEILSIFTEIYREDPSNLRSARDLAAILITTGDGYRKTGAVEKALPRLRQGLELIERIASATPKILDAQDDLMRALMRLASAEMSAGMEAAAEARFTRSLAVAEKIASLDPTGEFGHSSFLHQVDLVADETDHATPESAQRMLGRLLPLARKYARGSSAGYGSLVIMRMVLRSANLRVPGDPRRLAEYLEAVRMGEDTNARSYSPESAEEYLQSALDGAGAEELDQGKFVVARGHLERALALAQKLRLADDRLAAGRVANLAYDLATAQAALGDEQAARASLALSVELFSRAVGVDGTDWLVGWAAAKLRLSSKLAAEGDRAGAIGQLETVAPRIEANADKPAMGRVLAYLLVDLADLYSSVGRDADALAKISRTFSLAEAMAADDARRSEAAFLKARLHSTLASVLLKSGDQVRAEAELSTARSLFVETVRSLRGRDCPIAPLLAAAQALAANMAVGLPQAWLNALSEEISQRPKLNRKLGITSYAAPTAGAANAHAAFESLPAPAGLGCKW